MRYTLIQCLLYFKHMLNYIYSPCDICGHTLYKLYNTCPILPSLVAKPRSIVGKATEKVFRTVESSLNDLYIKRILHQHACDSNRNLIMWLHCSCEPYCVGRYVAELNTVDMT